MLLLLASSRAPSSRRIWCVRSSVLAPSETGAPHLNYLIEMRVEFLGYSKIRLLQQLEVGTVCIESRTVFKTYCVHSTVRTSSLVNCFYVFAGSISIGEVHAQLEIFFVFRRSIY